MRAAGSIGRTRRGRSSTASSMEPCAIASAVCLTALALSVSHGRSMTVVKPWLNTSVGRHRRRVLHRDWEHRQKAASGRATACQASSCRVRVVRCGQNASQGHSRSGLWQGWPLWAALSRCRPIVLSSAIGGYWQEAGAKGQMSEAWGFEHG